MTMPTAAVDAAMVRDRALQRFHRDPQFRHTVEIAVRIAATYATDRGGEFTAEDGDVARLAASVALILDDVTVVDFTRRDTRPPLPAAVAFDPVIVGRTWYDEHRPKEPHDHH